VVGGGHVQARALIVAALVVLASCSGRELTRSGAAEVIRESDRLSSGCLVPGGNATLTGAGISEGLFVRRGGPVLIGSPVDLTERGKEYFEAIREPSQFGAPVVLLPKEKPKAIIEVTGIADGPGDGVKQVEFDHTYGGLSDVVARYCHAGPHKKRAELRLFDDGWRVESIHFRL
jgi:hypothetical protein